MSAVRVCLTILLAVFLIVLTGSVAGASTVGKIQGTVSDEATGLPLPSANVTIVGTTMGAASSDLGEYFILNVPAGTYSVQASVMGYKPVVLNNVQVTADFTTYLHFSLESTVATTLEPIKVTAERPMVQRDKTGSLRVVDAQEIQNLPVRGYQDAASLQGGVVAVGHPLMASGATRLEESTNDPRLYIRGGRSNEVAYYVDGFSQQDPLTGISSTSINQNAINQVVVMTGGFDAEYGKIMSGVVNVVTKDAGSRYSGTLEAMTDNLASVVGGDTYDYNVYDASFGGPVPGVDNLGFYASGERRWSGDRSPKPVQSLGLTAEQEALFPDARLPNNSLSGYTWQGKLNYAPTSSMKFRLGMLGSVDHWQEYRHAYLFDLAHTPRYEDENNSVYGTFTHTLSPDFFYDVSVNWFYTERYRGDGVYFKDIFAYARDNNPLFDTATPLFYYGDQENGQHVWDDYLHRESSYVGFRGNATYQLDSHNTMKLGGEYRRHTLRRYQHLFPVQVGGSDAIAFLDVDNYGYTRTGQNQADDGPITSGRLAGLDGVKHPRDFSLYVRNQYQSEDFVLNAGLRYDYLDANTLKLRDEHLPLGEDRARLDPEDLVDASASNKLSPRIGIGFPVGQGTQFHANYGKFFQQPNLENLYVSYAYLEHKVQTGGYFFPFGNPNLRPEETTAYEFGFTRSLSPTSVFDATLFYKDVRNLVQVVSITAAPNNYSSYRNTDYGTIKGADFRFEMQRTRNVQASVYYTLSWARGTGSIGDTQRNIAWTQAEPPKLSSPLDFDQRHKVTVNLDWRLGAGQGPLVGKVRPLENAGINVLLNASSGTPYTPRLTYDEITLANVSALNAGSINQDNGPWNFRVDLKADRAFHVQGAELDAFVWILNVFNRRNAVTVYDGSGDALSTTWLDTPTGENSYATPEAQSLYRLKERNPNNFDIPRLIRFGIRTSF